MIKRTCIICKKEFVSSRNRDVKCCASYTCRGEYRKTGIYKNCFMCNKKFYVWQATLKRKNRGKYCSKKCLYDDKKHYENITEKNHYLWKGDSAGYHAKHEWIGKRLGKASICENCGTTKNVEWSNKNHKYSRNLKDWQQLCAKCHTSYDLGNGLRLLFKSL